MQNGQPMAAEHQWREAVRLDPDNGQAWELLGEYYQAAERWPEALEAFQHMLKLNPDQPDLHGHLAECALATNDLEMARQMAEVELKQNSRSVAALKVLILLSNKRGQTKDVLKYLRQLSDIEPQNVQLLVTFADELERDYDYDQAMIIIERILKIDSNNVAAYRLRGTAKFNKDSTPQGLARAEADFKQVLTLSPNDTEAHRYLGRIAMRLGKTDQAIKHLEAVGRGRPYASAHFLELANAYRKAGKTQQADALMRRFLALKQLNAQMQELRDRSEREPTHFDYFLKLGLLLIQSTESDYGGYDLYRFRYMKKEIKAPEFYLNKALALRPRDPQVLAALSQLESVYKRHIDTGLKMLKSNNLEQSKWHFSHALLLKPNDSRTQDAIQKAVLREINPSTNGTVFFTPTPNPKSAFVMPEPNSFQQQ